MLRTATHSSILHQNPDGRDADFDGRDDGRVRELWRTTLDIREFFKLKLAIFTCRFLGSKIELRLICKQRVAGSNPVSGSIPFRDLSRFSDQPLASINFSLTAESTPLSLWR